MFHAGDLVFHSGDKEVFRLTGVSRPETFRRVCLNSNAAYTGVQQVREQEAVTA